MYAITLHMMLRTHTRQVWICKVDVHSHALNCRLPLPHLIVGVQTVTLHQYAPPHVNNVDKFQICTVGVQAATMIKNNHRADLGVCVHTQGTPLHSI